MSLVPPEACKPQGVDDLYPRAWEALRENSRSVCVTAGAGAGKTEFLAQKATYLLQTGICQAPKRILAISFKRDAVRNLAERVEMRCRVVCHHYSKIARYELFCFYVLFSKTLVDLPDPLFALVFRIV